MGKRTAVIAACAALLLGACGPDEPSAVVDPAGQQRVRDAIGRAPIDPQLCEQARVQADISRRISSDTGTASYDAEWRALLRAYGC